MVLGLRCASVLQCVAVCCSVLQCVAVCCSVLQCVAVCCSVKWHLNCSVHMHVSARVLVEAKGVAMPYVVCLQAIVLRFQAPAKDGEIALQTPQTDHLPCSSEPSLSPNKPGPNEQGKRSVRGVWSTICPFLVGASAIRFATRKLELRHTVTASYKFL